MDDEPRYVRGTFRAKVTKPRRKKEPKGPNWPRIIGVLLFLWLLWSLMQHGHR
jgi:hypothetical protein